MSRLLAVTADHAAIARLEASYRAHQAQRRARSVLFFAALVVAVLLSAWMGEVDLVRFGTNFHKLPNYLASIMPQLRLGSLGADLAEWYWGFGRWFRLLMETILIAYVGTVLGFIGAIMLCFSASANLVRQRWVIAVSRRLLEIQRTVPEIVYALIFVIAFGLGPLPGVLALAIHTTGALGKLFAEVNENIDLRPVEGAYAAGGSWIQTMRYAVLPQVASNYASYALLRFEINVRGASVLGFVGAGGIGQELLTTIRQFYYADISAILLMIIVTVMLVDIGTERLRHYLLALETRP